MTLLQVHAAGFGKNSMYWQYRAIIFLSNGYRQALKRVILKDFLKSRIIVNYNFASCGY